MPIAECEILHIAKNKLRSTVASPAIAYAKKFDGISETPVDL
jgi:hypothetical protein